ncbi:hypothetical protein [Urbifossiella limnaea]|uniref:Thioredoxin domain-containing protein n=1 Tax=Urbifossiella limnaea TaxID=2528023 RepID=A0A517XYL0_9BACT|nr:hypothetical protein [Urbifossiella limnaea]QDU22604.1 hypothetical protein ETAA1_45870 [Urbifossiella limnaea]
MTKFGAAALAALVVLATGSAQDIDSGPKAGEKVTVLKAYGVVGTVEGKEADFAAERKNDPTVYLFVQSEHFGRPMARFIKVLDEKLKTANEKAGVVAVWIGDKEAFTKNKDYLPRVQMSLKLENTAYAAHEGEKSGPNGWGLNADAHVTVVVADKGKVAKSFAFVSVNETDVRSVLAAVKGEKK